MSYVLLKWEGGIAYKTICPTREISGDSTALVGFAELIMRWFIITVSPENQKIQNVKVVLVRHMKFTITVSNSVANQSFRKATCSMNIRQSLSFVKVSTVTKRDISIHSFSFFFWWPALMGFGLYW